MKALALALAAGISLVAFSAAAETIKVGVTPGPHAQILEKVKEEAAKKGLDIKVIEFSDYVVPNAALSSGDIEANSFQHQPYLDNQIADRGYKIVSVGTTVNFPIGLYSTKYKTFADILSCQRRILFFQVAARLVIIIQHPRQRRFKPA